MSFKVYLYGPIMTASVPVFFSVGGCFALLCFCPRIPLFHVMSVVAALHVRRALMRKNIHRLVPRLLFGRKSACEVLNMPARRYIRCLYVIFICLFSHVYGFMIALCFVM
jgi:hypothetical protein